jgi:hypothetical protein
MAANQSDLPKNTIGFSDYKNLMDIFRQMF